MSKISWPVIECDPDQNSHQNGHWEAIHDDLETLAVFFWSLGVFLSKHLHLHFFFIFAEDVLLWHCGSGEPSAILHLFVQLLVLQFTLQVLHGQKACFVLRVPVRILVALKFLAFGNWGRGVFHCGSDQSDTSDLSNLFCLDMFTFTPVFGLGELMVE